MSYISFLLETSTSISGSSSVKDTNFIEDILRAYADGIALALNLKKK
ncbi:hypothetical protein [Gottschalkia purinilytica]|nr:hypothetical protein [Gottschalkia purinilytica]